MSILKKIVSAKRNDIERDKRNMPVASLEKSNCFSMPVRSLEKSLLDPELYGIIAEFKRQSPSRGIINSTALPEEVCPAYFKAGASAVSVLTNNQFFGGSNEDLIKAGKLCNGPILRKEFIIDQYQVIESRSIGADAILLIADILSKGEMRRLSSLARSLKLEVLFEIHDESGIAKLPPDGRLVGVNSRNLASFDINMDILRRITGKLPTGIIKIAESGIHSEQAMLQLKNEGFTGFLIGERFMQESDPGIACRNFINNLNIPGS